MFKTLIVANNQDKWKTWGNKIQDLLEWYKGLISIDLIHVNFPSIPFDEIKGGKEINRKWYDENIHSLAIGKYDMVLFSVPLKQWKGGDIRGRWTADKIQEMQLGADESGTYSYNGIRHKGGRWFNIARHEISHALHKILKLQDKTHYYWELGNLEASRDELLNAKKPTMTTKYKYFKDSEIKGLQPELVSMLDKARGVAGVPFSINSGFRTKEQNIKAGGVEDSEHLTGYGVDLKCTDSATRWKILNALLQVGFTRIGVGENFLHAGCEPSKPTNMIWHYYK